MPPAKDRTPEQWAEAKYGKKLETSEQSSSSPSAPKGARPQLAQAMGQATQIKFVPRIYTIDYSPILRAAQDASVEFWEWPKDMTLGDFLDTALHLLFMEHGITLAGSTISDEAREALEAQKAQETREPVEV